MEEERKTKEEKQEIEERKEERVVWSFDIAEVSLMKKEISILKKEISDLKLTINSLNQVLSKVHFQKPAQANILTDIELTQTSPIIDTQQTQEKLNPTDTKYIELNQYIQQTQENKEIEKIAILEPKIKEIKENQHIQQTIQHISTGNVGVPTDNPTDTRQTDTSLKSLNPLISSTVSELKQNLLNRFKELSQQEFRVFSAIYSLEETEQIVDYALLSNKLNLTESSIRDYIMKLEKKGIPIIKEKLKNRKVSLAIKKELKDLFTLDKLLKIRESSSFSPRQLFIREFKEIKEESLEKAENSAKIEEKSQKISSNISENTNKIELNEQFYF